jgi:hypothetical protein
VDILQETHNDIVELIGSDEIITIREPSWIERINVEVQKYGDFSAPKRRENKQLPFFVAKIETILQELSIKAWEIFGVAMLMTDLFITERNCTSEMRALISLIGQHCSDLKNRQCVLLYNLPAVTSGKHYLTGEKFDAGGAVETNYPKQMRNMPRGYVNQTNLLKRPFREAFFKGAQSRNVFPRIDYSGLGNGFQTPAGMGSFSTSQVYRGPGAFGVPGGYFGPGMYGGSAGYGIGQSDTENYQGFSKRRMGRNAMPVTDFSMYGTGTGTGSNVGTGSAGGVAGEK